MAKIFIKRGTRAELDAAASASGLAAGEPYLITDEDKLAVGVSASAYADAAMDAELPDCQTWHGFPLPYELTLSYSPETRTVTLTPNASTFSLWIEGQETILGTVTSPAHADVTGVYFIYYDSAGTLSVSASAWDMYPGSDSPVAFVYYNAATADGVALIELHTAGRNRAWHASQHHAIGTYVKSGFEITGYTLETDTDAAVTFGLASGVIVDEDIETTIAQLEDGNGYTILYRDGETAWRWDYAASVPFKAGTYIQANTSSGGSYSLVDLAAGQFVNYYIFAIPALATNQQIMLIPGQAVHTSLSSAQTESVGALNLGADLFSELVGVWKLTFETKSNYVSTGKVQLMEVSRLSLTRSQISGNFSLGAHNSLTGRDAADAHSIDAITGLSDALAGQGQVSTFTIKTGADTLVTGDRVIADMQSSPFTLTLPAAPVQSDALWIKVVNADQNTLTLDGNGHNIFGASPVTVTYPYVDLNLVYLDATRGWV